MHAGHAAAWQQAPEFFFHVTEAKPEQRFHLSETEDKKATKWSQELMLKWHNEEKSAARKDPQQKPGGGWNPAHVVMAGRASAAPTMQVCWLQTSTNQ